LEQTGQHWLEQLTDDAEPAPATIQVPLDPVSEGAQPPPDAITTAPTAFELPLGPKLKPIELGLEQGGEVGPKWTANAR